MKRIISLSQKAVSTVISEMLMLAIVVALVVAVVVGVQGSISYYVRNKELAAITLVSTKGNGWMNFTAFHLGGDPVTISGHIYIEYENGTTKNLEALLTYRGMITTINGKFRLDEIKFGEQLRISVNITGIAEGTIHCVLFSKTHILAEVSEKVEIPSR